MGFADRDYNREDEYGQGFMAESPSCKRIIIATVIIFVLQILVTRRSTVEDFQRYYDDVAIPSEMVQLDSDNDEPLSDVDEKRWRDEQIRRAMDYQPEVSVLQEWMELDTDKVLHGQVWRLFTTALLHSRTSIMHILFNMLLLYWFGKTIEAQYGSREFMLFYVVAAVLASVAFVGIQLLTGDRVPGIGASGAVMAVICVFTMWNPGYTIRVYFLFPIQMRFVLAFYVLYDLHPLLLQLSGTNMRTGVAHAAHLGGLAFGFLYYRNAWKFEPTYNRLTEMLGKNSGRSRTPQRAPMAATTHDSDRILKKSRAAKSKEKFDAKVDAILAKISVEGEQNLTDAERKVLQDASDRYKKRKG